MSNDEKIEKYNEMIEKRNKWSKKWRDNNREKVREYSINYSKKLREFYKKWYGKEVLNKKGEVMELK